MDHELETGRASTCSSERRRRWGVLCGEGCGLWACSRLKSHTGRAASIFAMCYALQELVRILEPDAKSAIDVGARDTPIIEDFDWIEDRSTLDYSNPYSSERVKGISVDFFKFEPPKRYNLALCLQVLEHIHDATSFAQKLFQIADRVLITVPFKWRAGANKWHVQDPVDFDKLHGWTDREPLISAIIQERTGARRRSAGRSRNRLDEEGS